MKNMGKDDEKLAKLRKESLDRVRHNIKIGKVDDAINYLTNYIVYTAVLPGEVDKSELHYLLGNAFRKKGDFSEALNQYKVAVDLNPNSPAVEARKALQGILSFYYKDNYNH